jgi:endoglucanase
VYTQSIANSLHFYQDERDGPNYIASRSRTAPAHLNDQNAMTYLTRATTRVQGRFSGDLTALGKRINASGGWWDAGDYLKFVQTTSYTVAVLLSGVRDFPAQMGSGSTKSNFSAEAKFGVQWLLRMWNDPTRDALLSGRHRQRERKDPRRPRPLAAPAGRRHVRRLRSRRSLHPKPAVFRAGPPGSKISPNLAGRDAAVFAECFQVYKTSAPALAGKCLTAAEHVYDLADTNPSGDLLTVIPF